MNRGCVALLDGSLGVLASLPACLLACLLAYLVASCVCFILSLGRLCVLVSSLFTYELVTFLSIRLFKQ